MDNPFLRPGERLDDLHRNGLKIIQNPAGFCFGMDAVLLSGFAKAEKGAAVADLGTGTGILPILMSAKTEAAAFVGLEIQRELACMAARSVAYNGLGDRITIVRGDIRDCRGALKSAAFDAVTANPPYIAAHGGLKNKSGAETVSRHEVACRLDDLAETAARLLRFGGKLYMVHRPRRLADVMNSLRAHGLEPKIMRLVQPYAGAEPNLVLIGAAKGGKPMLRVLPTLVVYDGAGGYTDEVREIYYG